MKICECCGSLEQRENLSLCTSFDDINLGVGVRLYFMSLGYTALLFLFAFFLYSVYAIITNIETASTSF